MEKVDEHVKICFERTEKFLNQYKEANIPENETYLLQVRHEDETINVIKQQFNSLMNEIESVLAYMNANYFKNQLDEPQYRQNVSDLLNLAGILITLKQKMFKNTILTPLQDENLILMYLETCTKQIISLLTTTHGNKLKYRIVSLTRKYQVTIL